MPGTSVDDVLKDGTRCVVAGCRRKISQEHTTLCAKHLREYKNRCSSLGCSNQASARGSFCAECWQEIEQDLDKATKGDGTG